MNHYGNKLARGFSEGEEKEEGLASALFACLRGTSVQFLCSGNYGNRSSTNWRAFFTVTAAGIWAFYKSRRQAYERCLSLDFRWACVKGREVKMSLRGISSPFPFCTSPFTSHDWIVPIWEPCSTVTFISLELKTFTHTIWTLSNTGHTRRRWDI